MSYTYTSYVNALANTLVISSANTDFVLMLPTFISDAELRCYRDLDLPLTRVRDTGATVANQRLFTVPSNLGRFVVIEELRISGSDPQTITPSTKETINSLWPSDTAASSATVPRYYGMVTDQTLLLGPPPGSILSLEVIGTTRPNALSASNTTTPLSLYYPDLFFAASMISAAGWMKNYGAQADDPKQAVSWGQIYKDLLPSAALEAEKQRQRRT
jgi:hypothetical protein